MIVKRIGRYVAYLLIFFFTSTILAVVAFKFMPVYYTPLMVIRCVEQVSRGESPKIDHEWVPIDDMSHNLPQAVVASEDNLFMQHHGFDTEAIAQAYIESRRGGRERGASTISQQTAKNVFLWPGHSWVRKGLEVYFTVLIERVWGKKRIMEVYLNSIEMGDGIYGVKAACRHSFDKDCGDVTRHEAALIAASLPAPLERDSGHPTGWMRKRAGKIVDLMGKIEKLPWGK